MTRLTSLAALVPLLLAGCASVPKVAPQLAPVRAEALGLSGRTAAIDPRWWTAFGDPQLDSLIDQALAGNPNLEEALARVRIAEAQVEGQGAALRPQINGSGQISRAHIADRLLPPPIGGSTANLGLAYANFGWDLDLFGRQHAAIRQAAASAEAARLDADATRLTLSVSIARTYVGLARAERQIEVAQAFVKTRQDALRFIQSRRRNQLASDFNLRQAETLVAEAEQAQTRAVEQRDLLVHALAALTGRGADAYAQIRRPTLSLDTVPGVPADLPADLLGRRPDLLAGRARIAAAEQGRAEAKAAFLPDVSLSALAGLTAVGLSHFFTAGAGTWSGGAAVSLPIFQGGRLRANYRGATADLDRAIASYDDAVLGAVREAADALTAVGAGDADLAQQARVVHGLRETVRLDQVRTRTGLGSQLDAIDSGFRLLEAEQTLVDLQAETLTRRIQLIAALGGGFDPQGPRAAARATDPRS
ncbi:efflux transporter outer membrane subunit [Sphingomonas morindae]|uniref:Efflux transporter outer membrane subunit n=1 Tax=Sphingomonas morindae TaxID=1541170 RepID=A0ABY4X6L2_9SPHN|nr:efflux transporter outer membrane subunit [Sphingomonas morindae]USI72519.1 efflux transporter outer membrane subunit [Sphingomonas morindae]